MMRFGKLLLQDQLGVRLTPLQVYEAYSWSDESPAWPVSLPPPLPQNRNKKTLFLDIDEALIHTFAIENITDPVKKHIPGAKETRKYRCDFVARPHLKEFLQEVNQLFEVVFWTSGTASYCSAILSTLERDILQLSPSIYSLEESQGPQQSASVRANAPVHFYALSRSQTLEALQYMKYIPMAGRSPSTSLLIDDNVRSFPLTPRSGIRISPFFGPDPLIEQYALALKKLEQQGDAVDSETLQLFQKVSQRLRKMETDTALLDLLPLLRAVAARPLDEDVAHELDHWRPTDYIKCDDFSKTLDLSSETRRNLLGNVLTQRSSKAIPPFNDQKSNRRDLQFVNAYVQKMYELSQPPVSKL